MVCNICDINTSQGTVQFPYVGGQTALVISNLWLRFLYIYIYSQVHKAVEACKNVLRGLHGNKISQRELDRVSVS